LAVLVAFTTVVGAATATCTAFTSNVPTVRSEGIAEEVGQVVIECRGGDPAANDATLQTINVQIFLNTNVTSRRTIANDNTALESLLIIDDPIPGNTSAAKTCAANVLCTAFASGAGSPFGYKAAIGANAGTGVNIFQGRLISNNSVIWTGVPFDAPGTTPIRTLRLVNVRANANGLGLGSTLLPSAIQMFISISGTAAPNLSNSQLVVAYIQRGLNFGSQDNGASYLQCEPSDGSSARSFRLRFRERFPTAFRHAPNYTAPGAVVQNDLTQIYNTEHMYANPNIDGVVSSTHGRATQPTRLMATFTGLPTNVLLRFSRSLTFSTGDTVTYVQCFDATGTNCSEALLTGSTINITPTGGTATVVFEVTAANPTNQADITIPVTLRWGPISNGIAGPPGTGTVTVAGSYAPLSSTFTAITGPAPRFVADPADVVTFSINPCRTNLLFPYVTNQGGFDTGLVVSNTSQDKFGTVPQSGACTIEFYGVTGTSGAAPGAVTTESIPAGLYLKTSLAVGGNYGMPAAKEFEGYIIARCNFQYAHGFAFIYDFTPPTIDNAMGYLALVLDADKDGIKGGIIAIDPLTGIGVFANVQPLTRTGSIGEVRGQ